MTVHRHLVGGKWIAGMAGLDVINPSDDGCEKGFEALYKFAALKTVSIKHGDAR